VQIAFTITDYVTLGHEYCVFSWFPSPTSACLNDNLKLSVNIHNCWSVSRNSWDWCSRLFSF